MNPTTQHFHWTDRDTAARDLLQLAYHAPEYIRNQAWKLLDAVCSSAIIPELKALVLDPGNPHAAAAFRVITTIPGNIYFPEFEQYDQFGLKISSVIDLLIYHPINHEGILRLIDNVPQDERENLLWKALEKIPDLIAARLITFLDESPRPLDLNIAIELYQTGREDLRGWLQQRWDEIIYLCLICDVDRKPHEGILFHFLDAWPELKADLLRRCPAIKDEVEQQKINYEKRKMVDRDVRATPGWKKMEMLYEKALEGDETAFWTIYRQSWKRYRYDDIPQGALATHFIGKFAATNERVYKLCFLQLKHDKIVWVYPDVQEPFDVGLVSPIRDEAALALSKIVTPAVWEAMVDAFFINPMDDLERILYSCIAHLTDQLSGGTPPETIWEWDINRRPWFRVLTEPDPESQAMYAEYYGVEKTE